MNPSPLELLLQAACDDDTEEDDDLLLLIPAATVGRSSNITPDADTHLNQPHSSPIHCKNCSDWNSDKFDLNYTFSHKTTESS